MMDIGIINRFVKTVILDAHYAVEELIMIVVNVIQQIMYYIKQLAKILVLNHSMIIMEFVQHVILHV